MWPSHGVLIVILVSTLKMVISYVRYDALLRPFVLYVDKMGTDSFIRPRVAITML